MFFEVIQFTDFVDRPCTEDASILRVYAGEASGSITMNLAILQLISLRFGIKCYITRRFIIVYDDSFEGGQSAIRLSFKREIEVKSFPELKRFYEANYNDYNEDLDDHELDEDLKFFLPHKMFIIDTGSSEIQNAPPICLTPSLIDGNKYFHSLDLMIGINSANLKDVRIVYWINELYNSNELHIDNDSKEKFKRAYPHSCMAYDKNYSDIGVLYFICDSPLDDPEDAIDNMDDEDCSDIAIELKWTLSMESPFSILFMERGGISFSQIFQKWLFDPSYLSEDPADELRDDEDLTSLIRIGDFVEGGLLIGKHKYKKDEGFLYMGNSQVRKNVKLLKKYQKNPIDEDDLDWLMNDPRIGLLFERYDEKEYRFIPVQRTL